MAAGNLQGLLGLLGSFSPGQWTEDVYVKSPPYLVENSSGKVTVITQDSEAELVLDKLTKLLGLTKIKQGHTFYSVTRSKSIRAFRLFDWYVRRSWQHKDFAVLWAIIFIAETKSWSRSKISMESVAELTNCDMKLCAEIMQEILDGEASPASVQGFTEYTLDKQRVMASLAEHIEALPTWTEELVMRALCTETGGSVEEIHEQIITQGVGLAAAYKVAERLKHEGYLYPSRHFRVAEKGPMREYLSANCRNCFYGYTSEEKCLLDVFKQLEDTLSRHYGRKLTNEERIALFTSIKSVPFSSRIGRRVLESLGLIHQVEVLMGERRVLGMLKKIEQQYKIEFPIAKHEIEDGEPRSSR